MMIFPVPAEMPKIPKLQPRIQTSITADLSWKFKSKTPSGLVPWYLNQEVEKDILKTIE